MSIQTLAADCSVYDPLCQHKYYFVSFSNLTIP
jgi:hypothetical protein